MNNTITNYIFNESLIIYKLKKKISNNEYKNLFNKILKSKNKSKPSHERLRKAYWLLHSKVEDAIKLEEAFIVFETLNARGKDLETADLLKNYIFSQASDISSSQKIETNRLFRVSFIDRYRI